MRLELLLFLRWKEWHSDRTGGRRRCSWPSGLFLILCHTLRHRWARLSSKLVMLACHLPWPASNVIRMETYCLLCSTIFLPDKHDWNGTARHFAVQVDVSHSEVYAKCCFRTKRVRRKNDLLRENWGAVSRLMTVGKLPFIWESWFEAAHRRCIFKVY